MLSKLSLPSCLPSTGSALRDIVTLERFGVFPSWVKSGRPGPAWSKGSGSAQSPDNDWTRRRPNSK